MNITWRTAWQGQGIVVYRADAEVDRLHAPDIERVLLVHRGSGDSHSDLVQVVVEPGPELLVFPRDTGFAGRVHFEPQAFWAEQGCVYWVNKARALALVAADAAQPLAAGFRGASIPARGTCRTRRSDCALAIARPANLGTTEVAVHRKGQTFCSR